MVDRTEKISLAGSVSLGSSAGGESLGNSGGGAGYLLPFPNRR